MTTRPPDDARYLARDTVDCLPEGALASKLGLGRPLRVKLGLDPTAPDVHLGHTVVLRKLREFQDRGHVVVLIIGDFTARVGDPSGRSSTRPQLSGEEIDANARTYVEQAAKVLDLGRIELRHNSEWLDMPMEKLFALTRTTTVAQLLERDDFAKRYAAREPISITELLYPLMQAYDSVAVRSDVELGGTDQKFNLLLGRDVQRAYGIPEQVALTMPILAGLDGARKMSKSLGNHIGVTDAPAEMYGKTLSLPDTAMASWYELLLGAPASAGMSARDAKHALARQLVERLHSAAAAEAAATHFERVVVNGQPCVVKHVHLDDDFTMRVSGDLGCRPLRVWEAGMMDVAADVVDHAVLAAARNDGRNGWGAALLMRDATSELVPVGDDPLPESQHLGFLDHLAVMSARCAIS